MKTSVLGAGPWGTAFACLLNKNGNGVNLWAFKNILDKDVKPVNGIVITDDIKIAANNSEIIFVVLNSQFFIQTLDSLDFSNLKNKKFVVLTKGFVEWNSKFYLPFEVLNKKYNIDLNNIAALSGPNIATEIYQEMPSCTVVASQNIEFAKQVQTLISNKTFRAYTSKDISGVQICGILKNPIAIAAGICDGLYHDKSNNVKAALISRALTEMQVIGKLFNASPTTFFGLAGMGDLITTCFAGRNSKVGTMLAEGRKLNEILETFKPQVPEGAEQIKIIYNLIKGKVEAPIFEELYKVLYENKDAKVSLKNLMERKLKNEF